nr:hypothetical protein [uncultured Pseudogulbenkiania sp.]
MAVFGMLLATAVTGQELPVAIFIDQSFERLLHSETCPIPNANNSATAAIQQ